MKKLYMYSLSLASLSISMMSCDADKEDATKPTEAIEYTVVDANSSDLPIKARIDEKVDGVFAYTENYFITSAPYRFTTDKKYFWAHYSGQRFHTSRLPLHGSKINGNVMCMNGNDDGCDDKRPSTLWNLMATQRQTRELKWEYLLNGKGYRVEMSELPEPATWENVPARISLNESFHIKYTRNDVRDSLTIGLLFIPKDKINVVLSQPFIDLRAWMYPISPNKDTYTFSSKMLERPAQHYGRTGANDSVFINLITERHVVKVIDNKKMLISYTINDLRPIVIE